MESESQPEKKGINPVDLVLMLVVISFVATLVLLDRFAIPAFANTYRDFATELPGVTKAVISHVVPLGAAMTAFVVGSLGFYARARGSNTGALALGLSGIAIGVAGVVFCFYALYVPMFELAGKIKP